VSTTSTRRVRHRSQLSKSPRIRCTRPQQSWASRKHRAARAERRVVVQGAALMTRKRIGLGHGDTALIAVDVETKWVTVGVE
jgi:hypothetical protein